MELPGFIFSPNLDYAFGWTVLHSIWQITLIALLAGMVLLVQRNQPARVRYRIVSTALLAVLLCTIGTFAWYQRGYSHELKLVQSELQTITPSDSVVVGKYAVPLADLAPIRIKKADTSVKAGFMHYFEQHLPLIVLVWLLGLVFCLFRLMGSLSYVYYLKQRMNFSADPYWTDLLDTLAKRAGFTQTIGLVESALVRSTVTIGHLRPMILFPIGVINRLSEQEVAAILAHELAHILRRDYLINILQSVVEALFYYHPAVWWLSAQVRNERESACDDMAIALLGNKLNYAKALVTIQEMAFFSRTPALGMAGQNQSQLMTRMQRLFSQPKIKFNMFEKWIATGLVVCSIVALAFGQRFQHNTNNFDENNPATFYNDGRSGIWEATFEKDSVCLTLVSRTRNNNWTMGNCYPNSSFTNLNIQAGDTEFSMTRPAGTLQLRGKIENQSGYGRFEFQPNENFKNTLISQGIKNADDELLLYCFLGNFQSDYLDFMQKKGFKGIDKDKLTELAVFGLNEEEVNTYLDLHAKYSKKDGQSGADAQSAIDVQDMIEYKVFNITPEKIEAFAKAGYGNLDMEAIGQMSVQNIDPAYITAMNATGFGKLSSEDIMAAKIHGITPEFIQQCKNLNATANFDDVVSMKIHNITPEFIAECKGLGLGDLSMDDIRTIKIHNITPEFIQQAQAAGFGKLDLEQIMSIRIHNIDPAFIQQAQAAGFGKLDLDQIMTMRIHNIDPAFIQQAQAAGFGKLDLDQIMTMRIHNITPEFIKSCKDMKVGELSFDDAVSMRIHDISPAFAQSFRDAGIKDLSVEDLISARIHGVTPAFIKESEQKGYKFPHLDGYIDLKLQSQTGFGRRSN